MMKLVALKESVFPYSTRLVAQNWPCHTAQKSTSVTVLAQTNSAIIEVLALTKLRIDALILVFHAFGENKHEIKGGM